uniref:Uncharacterized protein n=1 Tax=Ciona savignyi TaxID=51511 RepID=H2YIX7_CIOSA
MRRPTITNGRTEYLPREFPSTNPPSAGDVLANFQPPSAAESSIETAMSGEVVSAATTMGFEADVIRIVQLKYISEHGEPISSVATLINELLEHDRASLKRTSDSTELQSSKQQKLGESDDQHDI